MELETIIRNLEELSLKKFINNHRHGLCDKTVNQQKLASCLNFDTDQIAIIEFICLCLKINGGLKFEVDEILPGWGSKLFGLQIMKIRPLPPQIMAPADNFGRCSKLYEYIEKMTSPANFIQALEKTNNCHVLKFIQFQSGPDPRNSSTFLKWGIWFNIPEPIDSFCGREDFLTHLHKKLQPPSDLMSTPEVTVLSQVKIVSGLGGIGKTETARRYMSQYFEFYNNFIWIDAESKNSMSNCFIELAEEIQIPVKDPEGKSRKIKKIIKDIYNKICEGEKSNLIIFDNAEDYQNCQEFFPSLPHPKMKKPLILATSRNQEWICPTGKIQVLPLDVLTPDESLEFILKQLGPEIPDSGSEFREEAKEFIELIGGLPLALQQAVAFIKQEKKLRKYIGKTYKMSDYVLEFKSGMKKFQSFSSFPVSGSGSSSTVFVTWNVTFEKIQKLDNGEAAIKILELLSLLYADKIPLSFLRDVVSEMEEREFMSGLQLLEKYCMIKINDINFYLSIHRQLQFVILQYLQECNAVFSVLMNLVEKCAVVLKGIKVSKSGDVFLNVHQIVNNQFSLIPQVTEKFLDFMYDFGSVLWRASQYSESLDLHHKVYNKRRELLGQSHVNTLRSQNQMALQLFQLGRHEESLSLFEENLKQKEIHLGVDHPSIVPTKHNMALVLREQKKYKESLQLFQQALAQFTTIHGENHPETINMQNAIALVQMDLGNLADALLLYEKIRKRQMEILGTDEVDVFVTKHNTAIILYKMGKFEEAARVFNEVLESQKEILGENHLDTVGTLNWIATTLEAQGQIQAALDIYNKVYEIRKTALGDKHPHTIKFKSSIVNVESQL